MAKKKSIIQWDDYYGFVEYGYVPDDPKNIKETDLAFEIIHTEDGDVRLYGKDSLIGVFENSQEAREYAEKRRKEYGSQRVKTSQNSKTDNAV